MNKIKCICIFVALLGMASAITAKSKLDNPEAISSDKLTPSQSTSPSTEFSSRLGVREDKKKSQNGFKSSVNFSERTKNSSSVSASSKSPQISYPDSGEDKSPVTEDSPNSLVLKLLDDKENEDFPASPKDENEDIYIEKARFPKIYYGEASPHYSTHGEGLDEHSGSRHHPGKQEEEPKYYYPKNYPSKSTGSKKKRFEYKHSEEQRHAPEHEEPRHHGNHQSPEKFDQDHEAYHHDGYKPEPHHHEHQHSHGYGHDLGHHEHDNGYGYPDHGHKYRHGHGVDVIGKALKVLIPSALLLTGVSALFPNRQYVPTNDYTFNNRRQKRSIEYGSSGNYNGHVSPSTQMLQREHRSLDTQSYELDDFGNVARQGNYAPSPMFEQGRNNDFEVLSTPNEHIQYVGKSPSYGHKAVIPKNSRLPFMRRPSTPLEYDQFNFGHQSTSPEFTSPDSMNAESISRSLTPIISTQEPSSVDSQSMSTAPMAETDLPKKRQRRVRMRQGMGIRKKIKSRPLPSSIDISKRIQEFHPIPESINIIDASRQIVHAEQLASRDSKQLADLVSSFESMNTLPAVRHLDNFEQNVETKNVDLSPDGPVMGLITSYAQHDSESPACQKRALCELALKGSQPATATKFETFLWSLATLVPDQFSKLYELEDIFKAIKTGGCQEFQCSSPNLEIQG